LYLLPVIWQPPRPSLYVDLVPADWAGERRSVSFVFRSHVLHNVGDVAGLHAANLADVVKVATVIAVATWEHWDERIVSLDKFELTTKGRRKTGDW
jgi:hypothetical protein